MNQTYYPASERGHTNSGWLDSYHSFSFGNWYHPKKTHFGALRVLNDDKVAPSAGFGMHPHSNMEIVSIPLEGTLLHRDTTGKDELIRTGDVQIMSAGTGIYHSEFNASKSEPVRFLQVWVLPKKTDIQPRYEQKTFAKPGAGKGWQVVVSPDQTEGGLWINQDSRFALAELGSGEEISFGPRFKNNLSYFFVIEGEVNVQGTALGRRDAIGITSAEPVSIRATMPARLLAIEIPPISQKS